MQYNYSHCLRVPTLNNDRSNNYNTKKCYVRTKREYQMSQRKKIVQKRPSQEGQDSFKRQYSLLVNASEIRLLSEIPDNQLSKM